MRACELLAAASNVFTEDTGAPTVADSRISAAGHKPSVDKGAQTVTNVDLARHIGTTIGATAVAKGGKDRIDQDTNVAAKVALEAWSIGGKNVDAAAVRPESHGRCIQGCGSFEGLAPFDGGAQLIEASGSGGAGETFVAANNSVRVGRAGELCASSLSLRNASLAHGAEEAIVAGDGIAGRQGDGMRCGND